PWKSTPRISSRSSPPHHSCLTAGWSIAIVSAYSTRRRPTAEVNRGDGGTAPPARCAPGSHRGPSSRQIGRPMRTCRCTARVWTIDVYTLYTGTPFIAEDRVAPFRNAGPDCRRAVDHRRPVRRTAARAEDSTAANADRAAARRRDPDRADRVQSRRTMAHGV